MRFISKQNQVTLVKQGETGTEFLHNDSFDGLIVKKQFNNHQQFLKEVYIGDLLRNSKSEQFLTPKLLTQEDPDVLYYEYISGRIAVEYLDETEMDPTNQSNSFSAVIGSILDWMVCFYNCMEEETGKEWILGDIHLRNFIISSEYQVYGIDFENCREGKREEDIAKLCAFILTYDPPFTETKIKILDEILDLIFVKLQLHRDLLKDHLLMELQLIEKRRDLKLDTRDINLVMRAFKE